MPKGVLILLLFFSLVVHATPDEECLVFSEEDAITFPQAEFLNQYTARIPLKLIDHLLVVEAELLGKTGNFIVDTGSEALILNKVHFLNTHRVRKKNSQSHSVLNSLETSYEKRVAEFKLQNFSLENKTSDIIDLSHIEETKKMNLLGIIGQSILKDFEVFIDLHLNQITLSKVNRFGEKFDTKVYSEKISDSIPFKLRKHTIVLEGFVETQKVLFALDSGAEFNQINKKNNKKVLQYFFPNKRLLLSGAGSKQIEVLAGKMHRVNLSKSVYFGPMNTVLTNLAQMNEAFGTNVDGVLGYEFFRQKRTIINYQKEMLYFINNPLQRH